MIIPITKAIPSERGNPGEVYIWPYDRDFKYGVYDTTAYFKEA